MFLLIIFNRVSIIIKDCFSFALLLLVIGPEILRFFLNQFKTETNRDLVTLVFPHFRQFARFYFELPLAALDISLLSDWLF